MHFFYYCPYVKLFWDEVRDWITVITRVSRATIGIRECFLGIIEDKFCPFINCVLLVARFFIYRCKFMNMKPSFDVFFNFLKEIKNSERRIAYKKWRHSQALEKWKPLSLLSYFANIDIYNTIKKKKKNRNRTKKPNYSV